MGTEQLECPGLEEKAAASKPMKRRFSEVSYTGGESDNEVAESLRLGGALPAGPLRRRRLSETAPTPPRAVAPRGSKKLPLQNLQSLVITLDRRPDRMEGCARRLNTNCPWLRYEKFSATDGKIHSLSPSEVVSVWNTTKNVKYQRLRAIRKGWDDLDTYVERELAMSPGEKGCAISHVRCWRHCLEMQSEGKPDIPLLVLEDDAEPIPDFSAVLQSAADALPDDAEVLYLGYSQAADWRRELSPELVEAEYVWTTVGYVIWPSAARRFLSQLPVDGPVDNWMAGFCGDGELKAYCVRPKIIRQCDPWNVNSDVRHSDELYWGPDSNIQHSDRFYWGPHSHEATAAAFDVNSGSEDSADEN